MPRPHADNYEKLIMLIQPQTGSGTNAPHKTSNKVLK